MQPPINVRHAEPSWLFSQDDDLIRPNARLIDLAIDAISEARKIELGEVLRRTPAGEIPYSEVWPGEHYKLLAALIKVLKPEVVVEIGTASGLSALSMKSVASPNTKIFTFDLIPWNQIPNTVLKEEDFSDRFVQHLEDLSTFTDFMKHKALLESANLIFVDASKDGVTEPNIVQNFLATRFLNSPIIVFDDIRLMNMLALWRIMPKPKLDLTSFGHWSGTGLVDWTE